jgi:hypothetical protein
MQQAAEGLLDVVHLAHGVFLAAGNHRVDAEGRALVALRKPRHEVERRGDVAAAGQVRKRAVGMAVQLVGGLREHAPRFQRRSLPIVKLVEHRFHAEASFIRCCSAA